ncbi:MAG TPA: LuxR C-terminal-related transcriptional regulator [Solirubrobacter sp.]|nr:LuxR C-terminal-related transcriptional regulator [Solirubrobacter sp.]
MRGRSEPTGAAEAGREAYAKRAWGEAYRRLSEADRTAPLGPDDLELLATSAFMVDREEEYRRHLERAHHAHLAAGDAGRAVLNAIWVGITLSLRGAPARASGWLARAQRLLDRERCDGVERGYLLLATARHLDVSAGPIAARAAEIGERFGDGDLVALALMEEGRALLRGGRVEDGLARLDEAMVSVEAGELSPIVVGLLYCSVLDGCWEVYALRHTQEWTTALARWCEQQPEMVAFAGWGMLHRAEILQLRGAWSDALEEAQRAGRRLGDVAAGPSSYRRGEIHRLRGEFAAAEEAYREASVHAWEPQPGLALLRLAAGDGSAAASAIRRAVGEAADPAQRLALLEACVDIMLATGDIEAARDACDELAELSNGLARDMVDAIVAHAEGAVTLAEGDAQSALVALRRAGRAWRELEAPYDQARVRELIGLACRALGDDDTAALEREAARNAFVRLGAAPDLARLDAVAPNSDHGLTPRELQVLRLVAAGHTNKAIAAELVVSERTVDRHVSNTFAKVGVGSRAAATAYAYEHGLV